MDPFRSAGAPVSQMLSAGSDQQLQALALGIRGPSVDAVGMSIPAFGAFIEASAQSTDSDILQTPHILATDNVPAEIHVQLNRSLQQNAQSYSSVAGLTGASGASAASALNPYLGAAPAAANYGKIGPQIKVTPHLNESDDVRLDVEETISDTDGTALGSLGTISFTERGAKTTLTVRDQQTVVIGGLVADKVLRKEVKVPLLGDIPVLGALFKHTSESHSKGDLVLVLTPYIVRDQEDMRRIVERRMEERQEYMEHAALFEDRPWSPPKTFARARGLLGLMRKDERRMEEERKNQEALVPRPVLVHDPNGPADPIELPAMSTPAPTNVANGTPGALGTPNAPGAPSSAPPGAGVRLER
jgi:general secretion pathway protein D